VLFRSQKVAQAREHENTFTFTISCPLEDAHPQAPWRHNEGGARYMYMKTRQTRERSHENNPSGTKPPTPKPSLEVVTRGVIHTDSEIVKPAAKIPGTGYVCVPAPPGVFLPGTCNE
jgi:hypothetical protein